MIKINDDIFSFQNEIMDNNSYVIINKNKGCLVIDPSWNVAEIIQFITKNNLNYKGSILTHCHFDHVGQIEQLMKHFNNFIVYCSKKAAEEIKSKNRLLFFNRSTNVSSINFKFLDDDSKIKDFDIKFLLTPGHSEGSMCFLYKQCLFTGDHIFIYDVGRVDLELSDLSKMKQSINKIKDFMKDNDDILILPGHGKFENWKYVKKYNKYIKNI